MLVRVRVSEKGSLQLRCASLEMAVQWQMSCVTNLCAGWSEVFWVVHNRGRFYPVPWRWSPRTGMEPLTCAEVAEAV